LPENPPVLRPLTLKSIEIDCQDRVVSQSEPFFEKARLEPVLKRPCFERAQLKRKLKIGKLLTLQ
jgi:hypothetical protein